MHKYDIYNAFDQPIPYKNLLFYPVKMKDYMMFHFLSSVLLEEKNSIPDINIIQMSYLQYLYETSSEENPKVAMLNELLKMTLDKKDIEISFGYMENNKKKPVFLVGEDVYTHDDLEEIKTILCNQNMLELPDETIQKELREKLAEAERHRNKNTVKMGTLEDQIICVLISTPLKLDDIYNLSIRKFSKILERVDAKLHYEIYLSASMSGFVEFKDKSFIKHWMADLTNKDSLLDKNTVSVDNMKNKISFADKMKKS